MATIKYLNGQLGGPAYQIGISPGFLLAMQAVGGTTLTYIVPTDYDTTKADYVSGFKLPILGGSIDITWRNHFRTIWVC